MMNMTLAPRERAGCSRKVSFELRKGTCDSFWPMAVITSPSAESDLLIAAVSAASDPVASVRESLSDPARSTSVRRPAGSSDGPLTS